MLWVTIILYRLCLYVKSMLSQTVLSTLKEVSEIMQPCDLSCDHRRRNFRGCRWIVRNIYSTHAPNIRGAKKVANYGPLGQKYLKILSGKRVVNIDVLYGLYFSDEETMLGDKHILHKNDDIHNYRWEKIRWNTGLVRVNFHEISQWKYLYGW